MKSFKMPFLIIAILMLSSNCKKNDPVPRINLIAYYPLTTDGVDLTGFNGPMTLHNTTFQNGGIYCNGKYEYSPDKDYCIAKSPSINSLKFNSFSISMDFFVSENSGQPVWIIGSGCRWLGYYLNLDGTVSLYYNNSNFFTTQTNYSLNEWHKAKISFDGTIAKIFLDNNLAGSLKFGDGNVPLDYNVCGNFDNEIGVTNYSDAEVFKGYVRNLQVYSPQ